MVYITLDPSRCGQELRLPQGYMASTMAPVYTIEFNPGLYLYAIRNCGFVFVVTTKEKLTHVYLPARRSIIYIFLRFHYYYVYLHTRLFHTVEIFINIMREYIKLMIFLFQYVLSMYMYEYSLNF